jgi:3-oxoacyl-[acyl-carrier-protein] synthase-3
LPGTVIAEALVDSGKYERVVYASSADISKMRTAELFNADKFRDTAKVFQKGQKPVDVKKIDPSSIDFILVDHKNFFESKSDLVKADLNLVGVQTLDVIACCPGYIMAVEIADALIKTRTFETITCVGAETMEKMADPRHLDHCLYGSAAGATTYQASSEPGIICSHIKGFGELWEYLMWGDGIPNPDGSPTGPYMLMKGPQLYRFVRRTLPKLLNELIEKSNKAVNSYLDPITLSTILLILHQMNGRLIEDIVCSACEIPITRRELKHGHLSGHIPKRAEEFIDQQVPISVHKLGNSSSATIPVLEDLARRGIIRSRFSDNSFEDKLKIGSGTIAGKKAAGAGFIIGGYLEQL